MCKIICANDAHIHDVTALISTTGIYKRIIYQNKLNLSYHEYMLRFVIPRLIGHCRVILDDSSDARVLGILICGSHADFSQSSADPTRHFSDEIVDELLAPIGELSMPESFYIHSLAVVPEMQGRWYGKQLFKEAEALAKQSGYKDNLSLTVWSNDVKAIGLYHSRGMIVTNLAKMKAANCPPLLLMRKTTQFMGYEDLCMSI
jgi:ribosomal protein S18 acetylase RimI-like enzyme